jgi:uncharacterized membrane protein YgcG
MASSADKRRAVAALAAERNRQGAGGRLLKRAAIALLLVFLITMPVLWAFGFFSTPKAVAEVKQLVDQQVAEYDRVARGEVPYGSAPSAGVFFEKMREVPREYREQVGQQMGRLWEARERAEMGSYFALPAEKRQAELDRRIKADEDRRKAWQAEREKRDQQRAAESQQANAGGGRGGPGGPGGAGGGPGGGGPPAGGGTPGGGRRGGTEESRNERSKRRLDSSTPEQRAQQAEYRRAMEERRKQLGLPTGGRRG